MEERATDDAIAQRARALLTEEVNARVEAVRVLAHASQQALDDEARARRSVVAHAAAYRAALDAGWTEKMLRAAGIRTPGATPSSRRRKHSIGTSAADGASE